MPMLKAQLRCGDKKFDCWLTEPEINKCLPRGLIRLVDDK